MNSIIKTPKSSLNIYTIEPGEQKLVEECVGEVKDKLILNPPIVVYDKQCVQHRSIGFFSDTSIGYKYSNQLSKSIKLTPKLTILLELINNKFKSEYNGILVNKYNDGNDYIGAHSDNETNLDNIGVISISYGAIRKFRIRDKTTRKIVKDIPTVPFQIIHMAGNFQKEFIHEIPIEKKVKGGRYSFTFRKHKN
jgi:alkylated DNA repair dioxygenase AlkB